MVVRTEGPVHQDQTVTTKSLLPNLKIEIETRNSKSKLEIEIGNRNWKSKLEIEIGNRNSKSKLEIETRSLVQFSRLSNFWGRPSVGPTFSDSVDHGGNFDIYLVGLDYEIKISISQGIIPTYRYRWFFWKIIKNHQKSVTIYGVTIYGSRLYTV